MGVNASVHVAAPVIPAPPRPGLSQPEVIGHPLVDDLRRTAQASLNRRLEQMFRVAGDRLLAWSESADSEAQRHAHFDAMRVLGFEQARILRSFEHELMRGFGAPVAASFSASDLRMPLLPEQDMEENLTLDHAAEMARARCKDSAAALEQRLDRAERDLELRALQAALNPRRWCAIYAASLNKLDLGYVVRKLLLKLFEETVLVDLGPVYADLHAALDRHSPRIEPPPAAVPRDQALTRVQRVVGYELAALINGRRLHPGARRFLCCAMAPLMSVRLMRHGVHHKLWHDALTRTAYILRTLEPRLYQPDQVPARNEHLDAVAADLREIGFAEAKVRELAASLQEAYAELDLSASGKQHARVR